MKHTTAVLLLLFTLSGTAQGQLRENMYFHQLTQQKGLLQEYNWFVFTDSKGLVWISSTHGLARFDGIQTKSYLPNARDTNALKGIHVMGDFAESADGNIWFAADNYLCQYVRKKDNFTHFQAHDAQGKPLTGYYRLLTQDSDGNLWVMVDDQHIGSPVYKFHIDPITGKFEFQWVCDMGISANRCYAIKNKGQVAALFAFQYDENIGYLQHILPSPEAAEPIYFKLPNQVKNDTLLDALDLNNGRFYALTDGGLFLIDLKTSSPQCVFTEKNITCITNDANGLLYLGTDYGQVIQINPEQQYKVVQQFQTKQQDTHNGAFISHLYIDPDATLWISYFYTGVAWVNLHKTKFHILKQKEDDNVIALLRDGKGQVWGIQGRSLLKFNNTGKISASYLAPNCDYEFEKICMVDQHTIGLLSYGEIYTFDIVHHRFNQVDRFSSEKRGFLDVGVLDRQTLLAGTYSGLFLYTNQGNGKYTNRRLPGFSESRSYTDLYRDQNGRVYIYQEATELLIFDYVQGQLNQLGAPIQFKADITSWAEDANFVWAGTNLGLLQIDKQNQHYRFFTKSDGLPGLSVSNLVIDPADGIWMHVNSRLVYFKDGRVRIYSKADGVSESMFTTGSSTMDARAALWTIAQEGLIVAKSNATVSLKSKAKVFVDAILINEQVDSTLRCVLTGNTNPDDIQKITIPFDKRNLKISFLALDYADPENNYLEYQIVNADTTWIRTSNPGFARFLGVQEGNYTLRIRAYNSDGISSSASKEITIIIQPPFERSPLYYLIWTVIIIGVVVGFFYYQRVQERKIQAIRQQIADDLHDEVGSVLTGIHMFSESLKRMISIQDREANYLLGRIGTNAQKTLSSFRDIVWAINPKYDRLEQLVYRMRLVVSETSDASNIKCSFDTSIIGQAQTKLNPKIRHNIFLIFKEALNNAVKYSKATKIDIKLEVNDRNLTLEVMDNGQGFDMEAPPSGNGLSNLKKRALALNGIFKFNSTLGKGTQLFLQISLKLRRLA